MLIVERGVFARALKTLATIIGRKAVSPFDHVLFEPAARGGVALTASDGTTTVSVMVPATNPIEACIPARDLIAAVNSAEAGDQIEFTVHNRETVLVTYPGVTATLANAPSFDFRAASAHSHDSGPSQTTDVAPLGASLNWVATAMCDDATRSHLCSVLIDGDHLVATDGHRLHVATVAGLGMPRALVPAKAIPLLLRVLSGKGQLEIMHGDGVIRFATEAWSVRARLLDQALFPPYRQVIPERAAAIFTMEIEAGDLAAAVRRVGVGRTGRQSVPLRLTANGKIVLATTGGEVQRVASVDPTSSTHDDSGADHVIGIDGRYLRDAAEATGDLTLRFADVMAPIVVDAGAYLAVVMPTRL